MSTLKPNAGPTAYAIPADLTQGIVNTLASLPWGQVNGVITPLLTVIKDQEAAAAAGAGAGTSD